MKIEEGKKKKILIVSAFFYPINTPRSFRTTELVKEFARQGHNVTVYIPKDDNVHIPFEKEHNVVINDLGENGVTEINIAKGNKFSIFIKRIIRRGLILLFHYPNILWMFRTRNVLKLENDYDLLITIAVPHPIHWGASWARTKKHRIAKIWIADCGDPFMGQTGDTFSNMFYFKYFEKWFGKKADYISIPFEGAKNAYYKEFQNKIKIISQGFNFDEIELDKKNNSVPTFAYAGGFIQGRRDPRELLEFLQGLKLEFKFYIYTNHKNIIEEFLNDPRIIFREYVPREELLSFLSGVDFVVNINNGNSAQLPSKLIDYYIIDKPVLSIDSFSFEKEVVLAFLEGDYTNKLVYDNPEQYRVENVANKFIELLN